MKVRWIGMLIAFVPVICQLFWLPDWTWEKGRHIANVGYWLMCIVAGIVGATVGVRETGSPHWSKSLLRLLIFVGIAWLGTFVGDSSGCSFIQRLPDKKDTPH